MEAERRRRWDGDGDFGGGDEEERVVHTEGMCMHEMDMINGMFGNAVVIQENELITKDKEDNGRLLHIHSIHHSLDLGPNNFSFIMRTSSRKAAISSRVAAIPWQSSWISPVLIAILSRLASSDGCFPGVFTGLTSPGPKFCRTERSEIFPKDVYSGADMSTSPSKARIGLGNISDLGPEWALLGLLKASPGSTTPLTSRFCGTGWEVPLSLVCDCRHSLLIEAFLTTREFEREYRLVGLSRGDKVYTTSPSCGSGGGFLVLLPRLKGDRLPFTACSLRSNGSLNGLDPE